MFKRIEDKVVIIVAALSQLSMQLVANMATVIMPKIGMELNLPSDMQLYINIIYLCSLVAISIPLAKVISIYGIKRSVKISCLLLIISLLLCGFSFNFYMIIIARLIQGIWCASLGISIYMMLTEELEDEELGAALGLVGSAGYVGLMLAPSFTGFVSFYMDWRIAFLILIPFFLLQLILLSLVKQEWTSEKHPIDNIGSLIYVLIMILFTVGLTELDNYGIICLPISIILIAALIKYEERQEHPIINVNLVKNVPLMIGNYLALATYFVTTIAITVVTYHLVYPEDMNLGTIGLIMLATPLTMVGVSIFAGKLSAKRDPRIISGCALVIILFSMLMFACLSFLSLPMIIFACIIQGIGHGLFSSPNNKYVLTLPENEKDLADASAMLSTSKEFGKILSSGIYALLFAFILQGMVLGPPHLDDELIYINHLMMVITELILLSAAILLVYSLLKYERYENPKIVEMSKRLIPKRLKKGYLKDRFKNRKHSD